MRRVGTDCSSAAPNWILENRTDMKIRVLSVRIKLVNSVIRQKSPQRKAKSSGECGLMKQGWCVTVAVSRGGSLCSRPKASEPYNLSDENRFPAFAAVARWFEFNSSGSRPAHSQGGRPHIDPRQHAGGPNAARWLAGN